MSTPRADLRLPAPPLPSWLNTLLPFDRYRVDLGAWRMHVMESGAGQPVLLVHGNPSWGFLYRKVMHELPGFRCIAPDLIGLGLSDKPASACVHTIDNHAAWLARLVEKLDLRDVILVVADWGGAIGSLAFAEQTERLAGLVVLNTALTPPRPGFKATAFHRFARTPIVSEIAFRGLGFPQVGLGIVQGDWHSISGEVADAYWYPLRDPRFRKAPLAMARMVPDSAAHPSIPALERCEALVRSLRIPTAIVWGKRDPVLGSVLNHMKRIFPDAPVTETSAGHFLQEEVPEEIAAAVRSVAAAGRRT